MQEIKINVQSHEELMQILYHGKYKVSNQSTITTEKQFLLVPIEEKDIVKKLGARWNVSFKKWEIQREHDITKFKRWLPCEMEYPFLYIDLVPSNTWFENLRSILKKDEWDTIRKYIYKRANNKCEICGEKGLKHPVEAHERWSFDENAKIQVLMGIQALCPSCHEATHFGLAGIRGRSESAKQHIMRINKWIDEEFEAHYNEAVNKWQNRSKKSWTLDTCFIIDTFGDILCEETKQKIIDLKNLNNTLDRTHIKTISRSEHSSYETPFISFKKINWFHWKTWYFIFGIILFVTYFVLYC